jgi:hypothetical protein
MMLLMLMLLLLLLVMVMLRLLVRLQWPKSCVTSLLPPFSQSGTSEVRGSRKALCERRNDGRYYSSDDRIGVLEALTITIIFIWEIQKKKEEKNKKNKMLKIRCSPSKMLTLP